MYQAYQFFQQAKSRKEMLEEMEEDYSGFFQGVKEVLKERDGKLTGIDGAVAELVIVPKQYETAMETALCGVDAAYCRRYRRKWQRKQYTI